jgi:hypothetical protein
MMMITFKDSGGKPLAVNAGDIGAVEYVDDELSAIHIRLGGDNVLTRVVKHTVEEIATALNKTTAFF